MAGRQFLIFLLFLLICNVCTGQKQEGYVDTRLTKQIKKMVCDHRYDEAYEIVLQNKKSLGYFFVEKFSSAYRSSQWIDTVSVDSSRLFKEQKDKLPCIGMFPANEYTTEIINGIEERILVKEGHPAIHSFNHFGTFIKLSEKSIRKIKRKLKRKGWHSGKIDSSWNEHDRRLLIYFAYLEINKRGYPISLHDKYQVHERILFYLLPPKPRPDKFAKRVGYKNARRIDKIKITNFSNSKNSMRKASITKKKDIRKFVRLLSRLKKVETPTAEKRNTVRDYWQLNFNYQEKDRQKYGGFDIIEISNQYFAISWQAYYPCSKEIMEFIDKF